MRHKKHYYAVLLLVLFKSSMASPFPKALIYQNHPVNALCFSLENKKSAVLNLDNCVSLKKEYSEVNKNSLLIKRGYIGYDWQKSQLPVSTPGFSYYKPFKIKDNQYWLHLLSNSGGTGEFSAILQVTRLAENQLAIKSLVSGDRCNGGVDVLSWQNKNLTYTVRLTAYDLVTLAIPMPRIKAYADLAACATCCIGRAVYRMDENSNSRFLYVEFDKATRLETMPSQGKLQNCFNHLLDNYLTKNQHRLTREKVKKFYQLFKESCR